MKAKGKILASLLCLLLVVVCILGLSACDLNYCTHEWGEWETTKDATCTTAGVKERKCVKCSTPETGTVEALGHDWGEATCTSPKSCKNCSAKDGAALPHSYTVEAVKTQTLKSAATCASAAVYYKSCPCGAISTSAEDTFLSGLVLEHIDENKDHTCDRDCSAPVGNHTDADKDHACDYGCTTAIGVCADADKDHDCDYGCDEVLGEHTDGDDANHLCDYGCGRSADSGCYDTVVNGKCDECDADIEHDCVDENKNHACDICSDDMGDHEDANKDHVCDYGCTNAIGNHVDVNYDHACDYGCSTVIGDHEDANTDHVCDYGCTVAIGKCEDADKDHDCDHGCDEVFGEHGDGDDANHLCDYGCGRSADGGCYDTVVDGKCDECNEKIAHDCTDANRNHACDICSDDMGDHEDVNKDHGCDYGCSVSIGDHTDIGKDHVCDYGCNTAIGDHEDANTDHVCDYGCTVAIGKCEDADKDHACDHGCDEVFGTCADGNYDHACDYGCSVSFGNHADSEDDTDHVCDYGCQAVLESCSDEEDDGDHDCDVCGSADITECSFSSATCAAPATCSECGATTGSTLSHEDKDFNHLCDNGCGKNDMGNCSDSDTDGDHVCDYGCQAVLENCSDVDTDGDHACDVCAKTDVSSHVYVLDSENSTAATCESAAVNSYVCNCGDSYTDEDKDALGHDITGVTPTERHVSGCKYELVYVCQRSGCGEEVVGDEPVYKHDYVATITTPATCVTDGVKTFTCSKCGDTGKTPETIYANATGHSWTKGEAADGVRTDTCSVCSATKTVTVYTGTTTDSVNASDLANKEIELKDANISLDSGVIDTIGDKNVTVSADKLEGDDRTDLGLTEEQLENQVGDNPIYNFTISDGTSNISKFGEDNWVTITLPYKLDEGEDVDSIAIWFISGECALEECEIENCEDSTHRLVSIEATYNNGYVTFKTNHFSYYTVTRLTPEERCALYGHGYLPQHVEGSCTKDAYDLYVCVRCHDKYVDEDSLVIADGHDYASVTHEASCTESGYIVHTCGDCGHSYSTKLAAIGHVYSVTESQEADCAADGFTKYDCQNCDAEYTIIYKKLAHDYESTVVPATCTADGYTLHDCKNCDYSYTDAFVEALGHAYQPTVWSWAVDYSSATLTFTCENEASHTVVISATVDKDVVNGTCSDFTRTTYTAYLTYGSEDYSDVKVVEIGTPGHVFSTEWSSDGEEHWHACICGERADVAEHSFENATVTKIPTCGESGESTSYCECGKTEVTTVPATAEHTYVDGVCSKCGGEEADTYYFNLVNSWKNINGVAIKLENLSFEMSEKDKGLLNSLKLIGSVKKLDVTELYFSVEDGEIKGAATGKLVVYNGPFYQADAIYEFKAVIHDGVIYLSTYLGKEEADWESSTKIPLDSVFGSMGTPTGVVAAVMSALEFVGDTVIPAIDTIVELNFATANEIFEDAFNMLFTFEEQEDGSVVAVLDFEKFLALNENLATKTISEVIDIYFGEGAFDKVYDLVLEILALELPEIPEYIDAIGLNYEALVEQINAFASQVGAPEGFDLDAMLTDSSMNGVTLGMLIFGSEDDSYVDEIDGFADMLRGSSLYSLIAPSAEDAKDMVADTINMISEFLTVSFATDSEGMLTDINLGVSGFVYEDENQKVTLDFGISFAINATIEVTWGDIIEEIEESIVLPTDEMIEATERRYFYNASGYVEYKGEIYEYQGMQILVDKTLKDNLQEISIYSDCTGFMRYYATFSANCYRFTLASITVDGNSVMLFIDELAPEEYHSDGKIIGVREMVELVPTETGFVAVYEDGSTKEIEVDTQNQPSDMVKFYYDMYLAIFDNPEGYATTVDIQYFYNAALEEYANDSQHSFEYEYKLEGDSCYDGCVEISTCLTCGKVEQYQYSGHREYTHFTSDGYDVCEYHCVNFSSCLCGEYCGYEFNQDSFLYDEASEAFYCEECGLMLVFTYEVAENGCLATYTNSISVKLLDITLYSDTESSTVANHNFTDTAVTEADGVVSVKSSCDKCGAESDTEVFSVTAPSELTSEGFSADYTFVPDKSAVYTLATQSMYGMILDGIAKPIVDSKMMILSPIVPSSIYLYRLVDGELVLVQEGFNAKGDNNQLLMSAELTEGATYVYRIEYRQSVSPNAKFCFSIALGEGEAECNHQSSETFNIRPDGATSCEDGVMRISFCNNCGTVRNAYFTYGHTTEEKEIKLSELGLCDGWISQRQCTVCGKVTHSEINDYGCDWNFVEITEDGYQVFNCLRCGATKLNFSESSEKDESCNFVTTEISVYMKDGEEIYRYETTYSSTSHRYEYRFELTGDSCNDGYTVFESCKDCDHYDEWDTSGHSTYTVFWYGEPCCDDHGAVVERCACGENVYVKFNEDSFRFDEESKTYVCDECGLTILDSITTEKVGCAETRSINVQITLFGETLYSYTDEVVVEMHNFTGKQFTLVDGKIVLTATCEGCSAETVTEFVVAELEYHDGEYYGDYTFTPSESSIYTYRLDSSVCYRADVYILLDGELKWIPQEGMDAVRLEAGNTYVFRMYGDSADTAVLALAKGDYSFTSHSGHRCGALLPDSESCTDGALTVYLCTECGFVFSPEINYEHWDNLTDYVDLSEQGACYGGVWYYSCVCGELESLEINGCMRHSSENEYYDGEGRLVHVDVYTCDSCNIRYTRSYYTEKSGCELIKHFTVLINTEDATVFEKEYTEIDEDHNCTVSGTLIGGTDCSGGVRVTYICKDCDYEYSYDTYWHESFQLERIDLSEYGSVCGGYATLNSCACGLNSSLSLEHSLCDFGEEWCELWIDDAIIGIHYTINGETYFGYNAGIKICAVTDPAEAACGFKIRYASYWLKSGDGCYADEYVTYQFGYDKESGECEYELTFKTGGRRVYHNYVDSSADGNVKLDCPDCGSYYYETYYVDGEGNSNKYEKHVKNTLDDGSNREYIRILENNYEAEDCTVYDNSEYEKFVYCDGSEYWYRSLENTEDYTYTLDGVECPGYKVTKVRIDSQDYSYEEEYAFVNYQGYEFRIYEERTQGDFWCRSDYSYTFDGPCVKTTVYADSDDYTDTFSEKICRFDRHVTVKEPTCTQDGETCWECIFCGNRSESYFNSPHGHNWVQVSGNWYYCYTCGLENANGVSGEIVMEDLTAQYGNGEYYVVGYCVYNSVEFVEFDKYVSLILSDNTEVVVLMDIEFITVDGVRAFAFSKAAIDAWASENGYADYDVRFSFVPYGADGSFDYGLTFAESTVDTENIVGNVSFVDYIAEGEVKIYTIAPTEDANWIFTSFVNYGDCSTVAYLCDENGAELASDSYGGVNGNFRIVYELKAGEVYTLKVSHINENHAGEVPLLFGIER